MRTRSQPRTVACSRWRPPPLLTPAQQRAWAVELAILKLNVRIESAAALQLAAEYKVPLR